MVRASLSPSSLREDPLTWVENWGEVTRFYQWVCKSHYTHRDLHIVTFQNMFKFYWNYWCRNSDVTCGLIHYEKPSQLNSSPIWGSLQYKASWGSCIQFFIDWIELNMQTAYKQIWINMESCFYLLQSESLCNALHKYRLTFVKCVCSKDNDKVCNSSGGLDLFSKQMERGFFLLQYCSSMITDRCCVS